MPLESPTPNTQGIVFIVDDDRSVREALDSLVRSAGFKVETFASARGFLARAQSEEPSCLVLDVRLPDLSGLDLQQRMEGQPRDSDSFYYWSRRCANLGAGHEGRRR